MPDMLVQLLKLPPVDGLLAEMRKEGTAIRRAHAFELTQLKEWVAREFSQTWADEVTVGHANKPISVYVAIRAGKLLGFGAYECTCPNFFGPTGVLKDERGKGIGKALLLACLHAMRDSGYAYAIIGGVGPADFYTKVCGATLIPDSVPGIYTDRIGKP
jgi:GNAT superfamily N-acetyltransferase